MQLSQVLRDYRFVFINSHHKNDISLQAVRRRASLIEYWRFSRLDATGWLRAEC